jgi:hypothetical protein
MSLLARSLQMTLPIGDLDDLQDQSARYHLSSIGNGAWEAAIFNTPSSPIGVRCHTDSHAQSSRNRLALNLDPVYVGAHHLVRIFFVSLAMPLLARRAVRPRKALDAPKPPPKRPPFED